MLSITKGATKSFSPTKKDPSIGGSWFSPTPPRVLTKIHFAFSVMGFYFQFDKWLLNIFWDGLNGLKILIWLTFSIEKSGNIICHKSLDFHSISEIYGNWNINIILLYSHTFSTLTKGMYYFNDNSFNFQNNVSFLGSNTVGFTL